MKAKTDRLKKAYKINIDSHKWITAVCLITLSSFTYAETSLNPYANATNYINPDYAQEVSHFFATHKNYISKAQRLGLVSDNSGSAASWKIPTAIWLDSKKAIAGDPMRGTHAMSYYLKDALSKATAENPVVTTFVIYDLPLRDCDANASNGEYNPQKGQDLTPELVESFETDYETNYIGAIQKTLNDFNKNPNAKNVRVVFIVEPDSLPNMITNSDDTPFCQMASKTNVYARGISYGLTTLSQFSNTYFYLDIAHSGWLGWSAHNANKIASVYNTKNIPGLDKVRGFITNTANYTPVTEAFSYKDYLLNNTIISSSFYGWNDAYDENSYISEIMSIDNNTGKGINDDQGQVTITNHVLSQIINPKYANMHFLIDTSRNGWMGTNQGGIPRADQRDHRGNWCNVENIKLSQYTTPTATGAGLGYLPISNPTLNFVTLDGTGKALPIDAYVWIKPPGESDGNYDTSSEKSDQMCSATNGDRHNEGHPTNSLQNSDGTAAPLAGLFFDDAFMKLIDNAPLTTSK